MELQRVDSTLVEPQQVANIRQELQEQVQEAKAELSEECLEHSTLAKVWEEQELLDNTPAELVLVAITQPELEERVRVDNTLELVVELPAVDNTPGLADNIPEV